MQMNSLFYFLDRFGVGFPLLMETRSHLRKGSGDISLMAKSGNPGKHALTCGKVRFELIVGQKVCSVKRPGQSVFPPVSGVCGNTSKGVYLSLDRTPEKES